MGSEERADTGMISDEAKRIIRDFPLGVVATIAPDGTPAASPKGTFLVLDDRTIAYGDIRSPGTRRNLETNPACEVVFVDPFSRKGFRLRGKAEIVSDSKAKFVELHPKWVETWGDLAVRVSALVVISVNRALPLATPPYDDGVTEEEMVALYVHKFGAIYPGGDP